MQELLKKIRESANYSQVEMSDELGVSFATINRWENGHTIPNMLAQEKIYDFCVKHSVPLYEFIIQKVHDFAKTIKIEDGRIVLYHGSKSWLERKCLQIVSEENRIKGVNKANEICKNYRREDRFFDEILDSARKGED